MTSPFPSQPAATIAPVEPAVAAAARARALRARGRDLRSARRQHRDRRLRQARRDQARPDRARVRRARPPRGRAGHGEDRARPRDRRQHRGRDSRQRIQCTPDLQPTDVTGLSVFDQRTRNFEFRPGPIFANVVLVDEINRATPKTQSALLEAMAEQQVTVDGVTRELPYPVPPPRDREPDRVRRARSRSRRRSSTASSCGPRSGIRSIEDELRDPRRTNASCTRSTSFARSSTVDEVQRAPRGRAARLRRRRAAPLGGRARAGDARARVGRHRQLGAGQPRARARGPRMGAPRRPKLRRSRGHRAALRPGAGPPGRLHAGFVARARASGWVEAVEEFRPSCLEVAPRPGSEEDPLFEGGLAPV